MTLKITHKHGTTAGTPPAAGDIDVGELAINAKTPQERCNRLNASFCNLALVLCRALLNPNCKM
jgi:hypothetical protein